LGSFAQKKNRGNPGGKGSSRRGCPLRKRFVATKEKKLQKRCRGKNLNRRGKGEKTLAIGK